MATVKSWLMPMDNSRSHDEGRPRSAETGSERLITIGRGDWQIRIESKSTMSATTEEFHVTDTLEAYEHEQRVFAKTWHLTVGRDHV